MSGSPHINQPGGPLRASTHPNIAGRESELRSLADAIRRLTAATVTFSASARETRQFADELHAVAERIEAYVPSETPPRYASNLERPEPHDFFQYDVMLGLYNPLALPIRMSWEAPRAIGHARFTTPYEGPPGCVHGAVIAGAFDQVFNVANLMHGAAGPTAELTLTYRRPTPLHEDLVFEARVESVDGRKIRTLGHVRHGGDITVEAAGLFIAMDRSGSLNLRNADEPESPLG